MKQGYGAQLGGSTASGLAQINEAQQGTGYGPAGLVNPHLLLLCHFGHLALQYQSSAPLASQGPSGLL